MIIGAPVGLVILQPDLGSSSVLVVMAMGIMLVAGAKLSSTDPSQRRIAATELAGSADPATRALLLEKLAAESDPAARSAMQKAVADIGDRLACGERAQLLFSGLSLGSVLLLVALGLAITYGLMGVINMAHGELLMVGAYATYSVQIGRASCRERV